MYKLVIQPKHLYHFIKAKKALKVKKMLTWKKKAFENTDIKLDASWITIFVYVKSIKAPCTYKKIRLIAFF